MFKTCILAIALSPVCSGFAQAISTPDASAEARAACQAGHYDVALADFKKLMATEPDNAVYKE